MFGQNFQIFPQNRTRLLVRYTTISNHSTAIAATILGFSVACSNQEILIEMAFNVDHRRYVLSPTG